MDESRAENWGRIDGLLRDALRRTHASIPEDRARFVEEFLDHNELGVAFETLVDAISESAIVLDDEVRGQLACAAHLMELPQATELQVRERVKLGDGPMPFFWEVPQIAWAADSTPVDLASEGDAARATSREWRELEAYLRPECYRNVIVTPDDIDRGIVDIEATLELDARLAAFVIALRTNGKILRANTEFSPWDAVADVPDLVERMDRVASVRANGFVRDPAHASELDPFTDLTTPGQTRYPVFADPVTGRPIARTPMMRLYRKALTTAGLDTEFRFHDLRHTFGTSMARAGEPVTTTQAWLGHGDLKTTQRYMHYAPAADEAERVGRAFAIDDNDEGTSWPRGTVAS